jgi:hypothetical protein
MLAMIVCAVLLVVIGYFAALMSTEVVWWLRDRVHLGKRTETQPTAAISRRQVVTR